MQAYCIKNAASGRADAARGDREIYSQRTRHHTCRRTHGRARFRLRRTGNGETFTSRTYTVDELLGLRYRLTTDSDYYYVDNDGNWNKLTDRMVGDLIAIEWWHVVMMILISTALSVIAGFIPSRIASRKDPVTCLRTE